MLSVGFGKCGLREEVRVKSCSSNASMGPRKDVWLEGYVTALSEEKYSCREIAKRCKAKGRPVSAATVSRIIRGIGQQRAKYPTENRKDSKAHPTTVRSRHTINKVRQMVRKENPPTQRCIANKLHIPQSTVNKIIRKDLGLKRVYKPRVHKLLPRHVAERRTNCRRLYEKYLAGDKWKNVGTLDEAWVYLNDTNKERSICYRKRDGTDRPTWYRQCRETFSKGFMVAAGFSYKGKFKLHKVDPKAKVNSVYYQENVLTPIIRDEIPAMYGNETKNVWLHQDKASSHTSKSTATFLTKMTAATGVNVIPFSDIPTKSPDCAPMDFCAFGLLKRGLGSRRPRTVAGLWKACQEVWSGIDMTVLRRSLLQWKLRCRQIVRMKGHQIEHSREWRKGIS